METDAIGGGNYIHARIYIYIYMIYRYQPK